MKLLFLLPLLLQLSAFSQSNKSIVSYSNPSSVSSPRGYSHVVLVDLGTCRMLTISGQVALDKDGKLIGKDDLATQTEQVFTNIKNIIEASGGTMNDLIRTGVYMIDASQVDAFRTVRNKFINTTNPPASTLVQVSRLFREDLLIEIEATVIIQKK